MPSPKSSTYLDFVGVLDDLPVALRSLRRARRLSQRAAATDAGVSYSSISRIENGAECDTTTLRSLLLWMDREPTNGD